MKLAFNTMPKVVLISMMLMSMSWQPVCAQRPQPRRSDAAMNGHGHLALYAFSIGAGVPSQAIAKIEEVERYLLDLRAVDPAAVDFKKTFPGIEGEILLCIHLNDSTRKDETLRDLRKITQSVDSLTLRPSSCSVR